MLLVLALTLIICSIAIPSFFNRTEHALFHELEKLNIIMVYLQQRAMAIHNEQRLIFDIKNNSYFFDNGKKRVTHTLNPLIRFGFFPRAKGPPAQPTAPITSPITFNMDKENNYHILFNSNGNISSGTIYLIDKYANTMGALTCSISQVSYIRRYVYRNSEGSWALLAE